VAVVALVGSAVGHPAAAEQAAVGSKEWVLN